MATVIEIDLDAALAIKDSLNLNRRIGQGLLSQVTISPMVRAAILASDRSGVDGVVGPFDNSTANVTSK
jgi:hypothetical protein